eukprot:125386_1
MSATFALIGGGGGYYSGFATKKYGKHVLAYAGVAIGVFSFLSFQGYIDFDKIQGDIEKNLDQDGDGDFDDNDKKILEEKINRNIKRISSLSIGFMLGFIAAFKVRRIIFK